MKTFGKILLWIVLAVIAAGVLAGAAAGYKYYQVSRSDAKAELVSEPECVSQTKPVRLGEKFVFRTVFRLPWGIRPVSLNAEPAQGSQITGKPEIKLLKRGWGTNLWQGIIPIQCYREGNIKEASGQAVFSNEQTIDLKLPSLQIEPPENQGTQLELAGELEIVSKTENWKKLIWTFAGLLILAVIVLIVLKIMKRERKKILPPWEKALNAIRSLMDKVRAGTAEPEKSIAMLTDIVRDYMEQRFRLRAGRQTTAEFMADLERGKGNLSDHHRDFLRGFLTAADMVKFAKLPADKGLFEDAAGKAEELIHATTPGEGGKEDKK